MRSTQTRKRARGFTLIEIMAVVLIMGLLMSLVGITVFAQVDKARVTTARAKIAQLESALEFYRLDNSRYPSTEQGLDALINKPSIPPEPRSYPKGGYMRNAEGLADPWGGPFNYQSPGQHNPHSFDVWSLGADASPGGTDSDGDIGNWRDAPGEGDFEG